MNLEMTVFPWYHSIFEDLCQNKNRLRQAADGVPFCEDSKITRWDAQTLYQTYNQSKET